MEVIVQRERERNDDWKEERTIGSDELVSVDGMNGMECTESTGGYQEAFSISSSAERVPLIVNFLLPLTLTLMPFYLCLFGMIGR